MIHLREIQVLLAVSFQLNENPSQDLFFFQPRYFYLKYRKKVVSLLGELRGYLTIVLDNDSHSSAIIIRMKLLYINVSKVFDQFLVGYFEFVLVWVTSSNARLSIRHSCGLLPCPD